MKFWKCVVLLSLSLAASSCAMDPAVDGDSDDSHPDSGKGDDTNPGDDAGAGAPTQVLAIDGSHWTRTITDPEVDCLWAAGYRHAIFGTQILEVTRSQLEVALRGGLTVDLYVYIYWNEVEEQIAEAVQLTTEFPEIGTIWIDLEENPGGRSAAQLIALTETAIAATQGFPFGIYTGKGFWQGAMNDTTAFADVPLWYARYDGNPSLDTYFPGGSHAFGGWQSVVGKQWDDHNPHLCDLAVDKNTMIVSATPSVVVDRQMPADDGDPPPAPVALLPNSGQQISTTYVKPTAPTVLEATSYEIELQTWDGDEFRPYWTTSRPTSDLLFFPVLDHVTFRWRMRAKNGHGTGPWSDWAWFNFGNVTSEPTLDQIFD